MGMFDYFYCKYKLPVEGLEGVEFQTYDTPRQFMDKYELREDGTLWYRQYDIEDRGDKTAPAGSWERVRGIVTPVNHRWVPEPFTGEIVFYSLKHEFSAYFIDGKLQNLVEVKEF